MNEKYIKELITKAKEIQEVQNAVMVGRYEVLMQKVNSLIGYILALEELTKND